MIQPKQNNLTFFEHVDILREHILRCLLAFVVICFLSFFFVKPLLKILVKPIGVLVYTAPGDAFLAHMNLALMVGFILTTPYIFYELWKFVSVGLRAEEQKGILFLIPFSFILFLSGALFAHFIIIPISLNFLMSFGSEILVPMITLKEYISYVVSSIIGCGLVFEMPLVLYFLTRIGIATPAFLIQKRKHAIVIILIVSAIVTPPDVISQVILAIPLLILYELGIGFSYWALRQRNSV